MPGAAVGDEYKFVITNPATAVLWKKDPYAQAMGSGHVETIAENKVTTICAPPTVWGMFVQEDMKGLDPDGSTGSVRSLSRCRQIR